MPDILSATWAIDAPPRARILAFQAMMASVPGAVEGDSSLLPLHHYWAEGCYIREMFLPQGSVYVGKIHRVDHPRFVLQGAVEIYTEYEGIVLYRAPCFSITKAGTKRVGFALEDTVIITVHVTNSRDLDEIEAEIICKSYEEFDAYQRQKGTG